MSVLLRIVGARDKFMSVLLRMLGRGQGGLLFGLLGRARVEGLRGAQQHVLSEE